MNNAIPLILVVAALGVVVYLMMKKKAPAGDNTGQTGTAPVGSNAQAQAGPAPTGVAAGLAAMLNPVAASAMQAYTIKQQTDASMPPRR